EDDGGVEPQADHQLDEPGREQHVHENVVELQQEPLDRTLLCAFRQAVGTMCLEAPGGLHAVQAGGRVAVEALHDLIYGHGMPDPSLPRLLGNRRSAHGSCSFPEAIFSDSARRQAWWSAGSAHASVSRPTRAVATGTRCKATSSRSFSRSVRRTAVSCFEASSIALKTDWAGAAPGSWVASSHPARARTPASKAGGGCQPVAAGGTRLRSS